MRGKSCCIILAATASILVLTPFPSFAARSPALKACSSQWAGLKKAGKTEGQTWPQFWSQCSRDFAAKNGGGEYDATGFCLSRFPPIKAFDSLPSIPPERLLKQTGDTLVLDASTCDARLNPFVLLRCWSLDPA